ncbi:MAG: response regulator [Elusimicrobiota bacterium]|jgi:DNA-binding response OmpR family regulator
MATATCTKVLLVDDDRHYLETLSDAMSLKGTEVHGVSSCAEALLRLKGGQLPALILLDVQLQDMHGFEFCRMLKRSLKWRKIPVLLLSAKYTDPSDRAEGLLAGADGYIAKPINPESLHQEIQHLLDRNA